MPPMPPRKAGGRAYKHGGKIFGDADMKPAKYGKGEVGDLWGSGKPRAKGGAVEGKKSAADKRGMTGIGERTPIQHSGNKSDTQNIGRGKPFSYKTGGAIYADGRDGHQMGPNLHAGSASGVGRLKKLAMGKNL